MHDLTLSFWRQWNSWKVQWQHRGTNGQKQGQSRTRGPASGPYCGPTHGDSRFFSSHCGESPCTPLVNSHDLGEEGKRLEIIYPLCQLIMEALLGATDGTKFWGHKEGTQSSRKSRATNQKSTCNYTLRVGTGTQERKKQAACELETPSWRSWHLSWPTNPPLISSTFLGLPCPFGAPLLGIQHLYTHPLAAQDPKVCPLQEYLLVPSYSPSKLTSHLIGMRNKF